MILSLKKLLTQVGKEDYVRLIAGNHNDNGSRLIDFATDYNLVIIKSTQFARKISTRDIKLWKNK